MVVSVGSLNYSERLYINRIVYIFTPTESCSVCSNAAFALHCRDNYDQVLTSPNSIVEVCQSGSLPCACQQLRFCGCLCFDVYATCTTDTEFGDTTYCEHRYYFR
jgi:hypothetical protein